MRGLQNQKKERSCDEMVLFASLTRISLDFAVFLSHNFEHRSGYVQWQPRGYSFEIANVTDARNSS
jgi:hypothetical protein